MCKVTKCDKAAFCKWLKTKAGQEAALELLAENAKLKKLLLAQMTSCCKTDCKSLKAIFKAIRVALFEIWKNQL